MDLKKYLYITTLLSSVAIASSYTCPTQDVDECSYTVVCEDRAGPAVNLACSSEPNVTFIVRNSVTETLTAGFFGATNFDSRVRSIKFNNNHWTNIESFAFKYYIKTIHVDLSNNHIHNIRNDTFRNMGAMESLNLSWNSIEYLNPNSFAISNSNNQLIKLDLSNNLLTTIASEQFANLANLNQLNLMNNRLKTLDDDCFTGLKNLLLLDLRNNSLTGINMTLINFKKLQGLDVSHNKLKKLSSFETNRLGALLFLNLSYNVIEEVEPECFKQAYDLQVVDLSNNKIRSPIESLMFMYNKQLKNLSLNNNNIELIQDNAFKYTALSNLCLKNNALKGDISNTQFFGLKDVKTLDLSRQNITAIRNNAFSTMTSLVSLNVSRNYINVIENASLPNSNSFNILDISHNSLTNLDFLQTSRTNLTELYVSENHLVIIKKGTFVNHTNIKVLDLSMNRIITLEQNSLPLLNLQYLNLTGNQLKGVLKNNILSPAKYLRYLDLSGFNLSGIDDDALIDCPLLARVNLSHNAIEYVGSRNFIYMNNLYSLDMSYNKLTKLQLKNSNLYNLKALYLNNNLLQNISNSFTDISKVLYLDLSNNNITQVSDEIFKTFDDLRVLQMANNNIRNFNTPQTNYLTKLMTLDLSSNFLTGLNLTYFPDLVDVDLSNNSFNFINSSFFQNLDHLQSINLSFNNISSISPGTFKTLKILRTLNVSSNHIKTLRYGSFRGLNRTEVIDLSRNGMHVLDVDIFHECTELRKLVIDYNLISELDFDRLVMIVTKLNALSLGGNPLKCKEIVRNFNKGFVRRVEVTSIDKIFEEDNVHGIWCGSVVTSTIAPATVPPAESVSHSLTSLILIWCTVLTILILIVGAGSYVYKNKRIVILRGSRSTRDTLEFSGSEYHSDLLT